MPGWGAYAAAVALSQLLSIGYVVVLYFIPSDVKRLPRDAPAHVVWRSVNVVLYSLLVAPAATFGGLWLIAPADALRHAWQSALFLAPHCVTVPAIAGPVASIVILFAGPLLESALRAAVGGASEPRQSALAWLGNPVAVRSRIVAPLTEEWVFRCCTLALFHGAGAGPVGSLLGTAAAFGGAHIHHYLERRREGWPPYDAALQVAMQFAYTAVFGSIVRGGAGTPPRLTANVRSPPRPTTAPQACYYLSFSGSFWGVALVHSFCNTNGLPRVSWWHDTHDPLHSRRKLLAAALVGGALCCIAATPAIARASRGPCAA